MEKFIIEVDNIPSEDLTTKTFQELRESYPKQVYISFGSIKEISEKYEQRLRDNNFFNDPKSTEFDGVDMFDNRVEFKYCTVKKGKKWQQVKPRCCDYFLLFDVNGGDVDAYFLYPHQISSKSCKENKEDGKLMLQRQHRGNLHEGQVSKNDEFLKLATHMGTYEFDVSNLLSKNDVLTVIDNIRVKLTNDRVKKHSIG